MIVCDKNIQKQIEEEATKNTRFMDAYKALKWRLQTSPSKIGEPTGEGLPIVYRVYRQDSDPLGNTPGIEIIITYHDDEVEINSLSIY